MDFILQNNTAPEVSPGVLNLQDWKMPAPALSSAESTLNLSSGKQLKVSTVPRMSSATILSLSDDELVYAANQGAFPEIWCQLFLRKITGEVRAIAPMLSVGKFFEAHKEEIAAIIQENLESDDKAEWVEYYAGCLHDYPIFKTALFAVSEEHREEIGLAYLSLFNDIKYLTRDQLLQLTTVQKVDILSTVLKSNQNDVGKRDIALSLFTKDEVVESQQIANLLGMTNSSVSCGALMKCPIFYNEHDNAYNTVATWIRHCINEKIGTNESVGYKAAQEIELQHGFSLSKAYIRNVAGQPIGGVNMVGAFGADTQIVKSPQQSFGQPIGL